MINWWKSIRDNLLQIKGYLIHIDTTTFFILCIIFVGVISFGLGRLSVSTSHQTLLTLQQAPETPLRPLYLGGEYVASSKGKTYYFPWCSGSKKISERNKIWFQNEYAAQRAGYVPARTCKGMQKNTQGVSKKR